MNDNSHSSRRHPAHHPPIERFNEPTIVQVNVCTQNRRPVLACDAVHDLCREVWQAAEYWHVGRYVIMPDHIHLFCSPGRIPMTRLKQWVQYWKGQVARRCSETPGVATGIKLWQRDYWDTQMRSREHYEEKLAYVRMNPVRKGLVGAPGEWLYKGEVHSLAWR